MKSNNNITVRYLNLKEHQFYEAYLYDDEIMETKEIALNYYHYNLGYPTLSDEFLFFNIAICFFWDELYDEKLTSYNLGSVLDNFQKFGDITPLKKLSSLNKKDIKSKIEKAKTFNFRDKLYLDLSKFYVDFIPQDSPIVSEYIEKLDEEILQAITFKFLLNRSKEDYIEFFEVYIYDYEEEEIDSFMKESKKHFSNFKKFINKDNLEGFENYMSEFDEEMIELYPIFTEFIMEKYKKEIIVELLDDNFDEYVIKRFELIKKIISSFSDIQLLKIIERLSSNMGNNIFLGKILLYVFLDEKLFLVYPLDKWNKIENYIYLWHNFLIDIGVNIEILAINQSKHKISRLLNTYKEHENKIEVKYTYLDDDGTINKKTEKLNINNDHELINEWSVIENIYENKDDVSIILNKKEVQFEDIASVFDCLLEKTEKGLNRDYCSFNEDGYPIETNCRLLSEIFPEIDLEKYYFDEKEYCFLNDKNIIIFNKDKISKDYKKTINYMQICPFFKKLRVKKFIKRLPKHVNPKTNNHWNLICKDYHSWYHFKNKWFNENGEFNFPGISNIIGIEKINKEKKELAKSLAFGDEYSSKSENFDLDDITEENIFIDNIDKNELEEISNLIVKFQKLIDSGVISINELDEEILDIIKLMEHNPELQKIININADKTKQSNLFDF